MKKIAKQNEGEGGRNDHRSEELQLEEESQAAAEDQEDAADDRMVEDVDEGLRHRARLGLSAPRLAMSMMFSSGIADAPSPRCGVSWKVVAADGGRSL